MPYDESNPRAHEDGQRRATAAARRRAATLILENRPVLPTANNGERDAPGAKPASFHKGLPHDAFGRPDPKAFAAFVDALRGAEYETPGNPAFDVPLGPEDAGGAWLGSDRSDPSQFASVRSFSTLIRDANGAAVPPLVRNWESPLAGHQFDLQGPDAGDVPMAPAPELGLSELCAEMAEVYAMAVLRDTSFDAMESEGAAGRVGTTVGEVIAELSALPWLDPAAEPTYSPSGDRAHQERRRRARIVEALDSTAPAALATSNLFRGSAPGAKVGPAVSQFMLIGSAALGGSGERTRVPDPKDARQLGLLMAPHAPAPKERGAPISRVASFAGLTEEVHDHEAPAVGPADGYVLFGAQRIDQRVATHLARRDHMTDWALWLDVQMGADTRGQDAHEPAPPRFIGTPRDLATFVHFDQLYQAYFNACLLLFAYGRPFDLGFPSGSSHATRGSFATWGGPHVLSLMTEVASRALKAVRRQKFQHHLRGRPEQVAAMLTLVANEARPGLGEDNERRLRGMLAELKDRAPGLMGAVAEINRRQNAVRAEDGSIFPRLDGEPPSGCPAIDPAHNYLLPMAFPEGSPMHAAYGAGHATVAGACVTMLKAFFELSRGSKKDLTVGAERPLDAARIKAEPVWWERQTMDALPGLDAVYVADDATDRATLRATDHAPASLTIEGELNKLAANVSIGRNMAGVHYYTDYYDSLRLGERIAVGMLHEQAVTCCDAFTMRLTSFDDDHLIVEGDGAGNAAVHARPADVHGGTGQGPFADAHAEWWGRHQGAAASVDA